MKKVAIVFVLAVLLPSLVLAWLAVRSLRDQQFVLERQQSLLYQGITDSLARQIATLLEQHQHEFGSQVEALLAQSSPERIATKFNEQLRTNWPSAKIGFVVTTGGQLLSPAPLGGLEARTFRSDNGQFLTGNESAEIYFNNFKFQQVQIAGANQSPANIAETTILAKDVPELKRSEQINIQVATDNRASSAQSRLQPAMVAQYDASNASALDRKYSDYAANRSNRLRAEADKPNNSNSDGKQKVEREVDPAQNRNQVDQSVINNSGRLNYRSVQPQQKLEVARANKDYFEAVSQQQAQQQEFSKVAPTEAEFKQLIGEGNEGTLARFVNNKLNVLFWYHSPREQHYIFGAQLDLSKLTAELQDQVNAAVPYQSWSRFSRHAAPEICLAVLNDMAKPVVLSRSGFQANWKHPFVATEIGEALPHWEVTAYLLNPDALTQSAKTIKLTLGLLIGLLVFAIAIGSWLIVSDLNRQLKLARQKTDFVSNVSHELKTPLTSIRMFSELLSEGRVHDTTKQRSYLNIITAETARLTRLINNVLDFSRMERGEKKYNIRDCDLVQLARDSVESYRPHLENGGFKLDSDFGLSLLPVRGDCDALAQVIVNLLSNAEKYSNADKHIVVKVSQRDGPLPCAEFQVCDRGLGVPRGCEEKIFEKFYRAHDSLSSGIQGSGLGLTLARQIARAHGGDVAYEPREGGGSCFSLRLPLKLGDSDLKT